MATRMGRLERRVKVTFELLDVDEPGEDVDRLECLVTEAETGYALDLFHDAAILDEPRGVGLAPPTPTRGEIHLRLAAKYQGPPMIVIGREDGRSITIKSNDYLASTRQRAQGVR